MPGEPHVTIGADRGFTFDHVFDMPTPQMNVYADCVHNLVEGIFDGFNATVLAYGQVMRMKKGPFVNFALILIRYSAWLLVVFWRDSQNEWTWS